MSFREIIKANREGLKEKQSEYGKRFGVTGTAVSLWESGNRTHIPSQVIDFVLSGVYRESCRFCDGRGYTLKTRKNYEQI